MGFMDQFKKMAGINGNDGDYENDNDYADSVPSTIGFDDDYSAPAKTSTIKSRTLSIPATAHLQVVVMKPERYGDAASIADHFKNKKTVVLNLDNTNKDVANRLIDFLGGVAYAMDGELKLIANMTYIIVPFNVDISGDMIDELGGNADFM